MAGNVQEPSSSHHKRAMDLLTLNQAALNADDRVVEGGGLRSAWSPDHESERDPPQTSFAALGSRISQRFTTVAQQPEFWNKFKQKESKSVGWLRSIKALSTSSCMWKHSSTKLSLKFGYR